MTSKIVVNNIESDAGISSVTLISHVAGHNSTQNISGINSVTANAFYGDGSNLTGAGPTLTNGADNRVVTASSANALNGEANLTFNGTNLGIGVASPSQKLHLKDTAPMAQIESSSYSSFVGTAEANDNIGNGTKAGNLVLRGQTGISISGNGGTATQVKIDADGIKFGTDTAAANALDDYEEGVFTPTLAGGTSAHNMHYTKIGRVVHISGTLAFDSISGQSGNMTIGGLPYTSINTLDSYTTLCSHAYDSLNVGNTTYQFQTLRINSGSTNMMIIIPAGNGNIRTFAQYSHVSGSTFRFRVAGYYITA